MARHVWSVICRKSVTDDKKQLTLVDVIESITLHEKEPLDLFEAGQEGVYVEFAFEFVSLWTRSEPEVPETGTIRHCVRSPDGVLLTQPETALDLETRPNARIILKVPAIPIRGTGIYEWIVQIKGPSGKWRRVAMSPLRMNFAPREPSPPAAIEP